MATVTITLTDKGEENDELACHVEYGDVEVNPELPSHAAAIAMTAFLTTMVKETVYHDLAGFSDVEH